MSVIGLCVTFYAAIFAVTNPLSAIPIFLSLTSNLYTKDRNRVALITCITVPIIVIISILMGSLILKFFGISINAFRIAGGIMICNVAFPMLSGSMGAQKQNEQEKEELSQTTIASNHKFQPSSIAIIPLAMPLLAGPGTISTSILWADRITDIWIFGAFVVTLAIYACTVFGLFMVSPFITNVLGTTGMNVVTRVMGLFMLSLGVQFIISAIINIGGDLKLWTALSHFAPSLA